jgi:large subunit ribosomal protein L30
MTTKPEPKTAAKPKVAKAPAKVTTKPVVSSETPKAKAEAKKQPAAAGTVKVTQMIGTIARKWDQQATLVGLGLGKRHRSRVLKDTPEVRGMIYKVRHLVKVEKAS